MLLGFHSFSRFYLGEYLDIAGIADDTGGPHFLSMGKGEKFKLTTAYFARRLTAYP